MSSSSQSSPKSSFAGSTESSDSDPFYLERYYPFLDQPGRPRAVSSASAPGRLERAPFQTKDDSSTSAGSEHEASGDNEEDPGHEDHDEGSSTGSGSNNPSDHPVEDVVSSDHDGEDVSAQEGSSGLSDGSLTYVADSNQAEEDEWLSDESTLINDMGFMTTAVSEYMSSSVYSDEETGRVGHHSPGPSPTLAPISGQNPVAGPNYADSYSISPMHIQQSHTSRTSRFSSSQERDFDENIGRKGPQSISYLEQYAIEQEHEAQESRQAAKEDAKQEVETQQRAGTTTTFAQLREQTRANSEHDPDRTPAIMEWFAQTGSAQQVADNATGAPGEEPSDSDSSSDISSSYCSLPANNTPQFPEGDHTSDYPHTNANHAYEQGHAAGMNKGHRKGYRKGYKEGKKCGYNQACDDNLTYNNTHNNYLSRPASEQPLQRAEPTTMALSRENGTAITLEELMQEVGNMMDRLDIPRKGTGSKRSHDEIREFWKDVQPQLEAGEYTNTPLQQENEPHQPTSASPPELQDSSTSRPEPRAPSIHSTNSSWRGKSTTEKLEELDDFFEDPSDEWERRQMEVRNRDNHARAYTQLARPEPGDPTLEDEEQAGQPATQDS